MSKSNVIPHNWEVPQVFRGRLGTHAGRQRIMTADGHLLIIIHEVPKDEATDRSARLYWRKPDGTWKSTGSGVATVAALRAHVEEFQVAVDAMEARAARATRASEWFLLLHESAPLLRTVRGMAATLQEARDAAKTDPGLIAVRDMGQDIEREVELVHGHARAGLDYAIAKSSEDAAEQSKHALDAQHRLNLIAATFLPVSALGALFSMQLSHGLEHYQEPWLFWVVAASAFVLGLLVRWSVGRSVRRDVHAP